MHPAGLYPEALGCDTYVRKKLGILVSPSPGLHFTAWEEELENDCDKQFLLNGIKNGFDIIDSEVQVTPASCKNHPSATPSSPLFKKATKQVKKELECGNYIICDKPHKIISPMAAIPKPDGDVRLIHDCSRPVGHAVNDYCSSDWGQKFSHIDDAAALMSEECYLAKVDLKSAYRSVKISQNSQTVTGFQWNFNGRTIYMKDTKLPFGAKLSVGIFHRLTQAVKRMMARKGYDQIIVYLGRFFDNCRVQREMRRGPK